MCRGFDMVCVCRRRMRRGVCCRASQHVRSSAPKSRRSGEPEAAVAADLRADVCRNCRVECANARRRGSGDVRKPDDTFGHAVAAACTGLGDGVDTTTSGSPRNRREPWFLPSPPWSRHCQSVSWLAGLLLAIVNVEAFGWRLPIYLFPADWLRLGALALAAALLSALIPLRRLAAIAPTDLLKGVCQ